MQITRRISRLRPRWARTGFGGGGGDKPSCSRDAEIGWKLVTVRICKGKNCSPHRAESTAETIEGAPSVPLEARYYAALVKDAVYYKTAYKPYVFYLITAEVSDESPIPVMLYSFRIHWHCIDRPRK